MAKQNIKMEKRTLDSTLLDKAVTFAVVAHSGMERKGKGFPYIIHPMEAAAIVATITPDQEMLAAAVLHDVIEDCGVTHEQLSNQFSERVAKLVDFESDVPVQFLSMEESWHMRKQYALDQLHKASLDEKIVTIGDKLSNMRAIARDYHKDGENLWTRFHVTDPKEHAWRYRELVKALQDLDYTEAFQEFASLVQQIFGKY